VEGAERSGRATQFDAAARALVAAVGRAFRGTSRSPPRFSAVARATHAHYLRDEPPLDVLEERERYPALHALVGHAEVRDVALDKVMEDVLRGGEGGTFFHRLSGVNHDRV